MKKDGLLLITLILCAAAALLLAGAIKLQSAPSDHYAQEHAAKKDDEKVTEQAQNALSPMLVTDCGREIVLRCSSIYKASAGISVKSNEKVVTLFSCL